LKLIKLIPHTCPVSVHYKWKPANAVKWLVQNEYSRGSVAKNPNVNPATIQEYQKNLYGQDIAYMVAWRAREALRESIYGSHEKSFQYIPKLLLVMEAEERAWTQLEIDENTGQFIRCWILPKATANTSSSCRCFAAVDGTFGKTVYKQTILALLILDGNNEILPVAWAVTGGENSENWRWFFSGVAPYLPQLNRRKSVIISDREKGIEKAVAICFPSAAHSHCCQHIADNVVKKFPGINSRRLFWRAAYAKSAYLFHQEIEKIREISKNLAEYLENIPAERWAFSALSRAQYGHLTSNIQEPVNKNWLKARGLPVAYCLVKIWAELMETLYKRKGKKHQSIRLTDFARCYIEKQYRLAGEYTARMSEIDVAIVTHRSGKDQLVQLGEGKCTCLEFQDYEMPCRHAIAVCIHTGQEPEDFISRYYKMDVYRKTYELSMHLIQIQELQADDSCLAPAIRPQKGRPRKKRLRKKVLGSKGKRKMHCSLCDSLHHRRPQCDGSGPAGGTGDEGADEETEEEAEEEEKAEEKADEEAEEEAEEEADWRTARTRQQVQQALEILEEVSISDQNEEEEDSHQFDDAEALSERELQTRKYDLAREAEQQANEEQEVLKEQKQAAEESETAEEAEGAQFALPIYMSQQQEEEDEKEEEKEASEEEEEKDSEESATSSEHARWALAEDPDIAAMQWNIRRHIQQNGGSKRDPFGFIRSWRRRIEELEELREIEPWEWKDETAKQRMLWAERGRNHLSAAQYQGCFPPQRPRVPRNSRLFPNMPRWSAGFWRDPIEGEEGFEELKTYIVQESVEKAARAEFYLAKKAASLERQKEKEVEEDIKRAEQAKKDKRNARRRELRQIRNGAEMAEAKGGSESGTEAITRRHTRALSTAQLAMVSKNKKRKT
jgi:hypothetical protein